MKSHQISKSPYKPSRTYVQNPYVTPKRPSSLNKFKSYQLLTNICRKVTPQSASLKIDKEVVVENNNFESAWSKGLSAAIERIFIMHRINVFDSNACKFTIHFSVEKE